MQVKRINIFLSIYYKRSYNFLEYLYNTYNLRYIEGNISLLFDFHSIRLALQTSFRDGFKQLNFRILPQIYTN